jgi:lipopolysaccharide/colanic/teichoic acid biosynthesis glycosyltransferase
MYQRFGKRAFDVIAGTALALVALPVMVLLCAGSTIVFRTWPVFVQQRVGHRGRVFSFPKIRTLRQSATRALDKYELDAAAIPWWGRTLRRSHLDELPQLLLVPLGRMSLVGPRPEMTELMDRYPPHLAAARQTVRPGCTGVWQISESAAKMIYEAPEYDLVYVENVSLRLDLWLLFRTVPGLLFAPPIAGIDALPDFVRVPSPDCPGESDTSEWELLPDRARDTG